VVALAGSANGTFRYEYTPPVLRVVAAPAVLVTGGTYAVEIDPPQPFTIELLRTSSDPSVFPDVRDRIGAFESTAVLPLFPQRTSSAVTLTLTLPSEHGGRRVSFATQVLNPKPSIGYLDPAHTPAW